MGKKLDIIVTHYNESFDVCKPLLDSISLQKGMDFKDIRVILVNDGSDTPFVLSSEMFPYEVITLHSEHIGISGARNVGLDFSDAEYVMFCDCDDMFLNIYSLHEILNECRIGFDYMCGCFIEEQPDEDGDGWRIFNHSKDITFIHGKVYNRQFLVDNNLRFDENLTMHEDGYFNVLVDMTATRKKMGTMPLYLWVWNKDSVVRKYNKKSFLFETYPQLMDVRIAMARQISERGFINEFFDNVITTVVHSYLDFQKPFAVDPENRLLILKAKKSFKRFYDEFGTTFKECSKQRIADVMAIARIEAYNNGLLVESQTLKEFIKEIESM